MLKWKHNSSNSTANGFKGWYSKLFNNVLRKHLYLILFYNLKPTYSNSISQANHKSKQSQCKYLNFSEDTLSLCLNHPPKKELLVVFISRDLIMLHVFCSTLYSLHWPYWPSVLKTKTKKYQLGSQVIIQKWTIR